MDLRLQPKPEVEILPADQGIVSRKEFFVKKKFEEINQYFFAGHFVRDWKPKAELIYPQFSDEAAIQYECDFNREVQNCFVEDYAEEVFLRTPPPCFVVFGKFERKVNELCEKLSNEYGSVLIQVHDIVNQVIKKNTDTSKLLDRILRLGVSITLNFILALVSYVAHTPEARHRGYVLSGLPCLPLSYDLSVEQQFHYLFTWDNKPTFFINVSFNDEDLIKERTNLRVGFTGDGRQKCFKFHSVYQWIPDDDDESDIDDEMLPIKEDPPPFEPDVNILPSRQWVQLPGDEESRVWCELEQFDNIIRPVIELISSRVDPQYFITLDSRVHNEFEVVQARLRLLQVWKAPEAKPFFLPSKREESVAEDNEEEEVEEEVVDEEINDEDYLLIQEIDKAPQEGFLALFSKKTISPKFRWELSHYNYICPVSLREGEVLEGKTKFAVSFMKYIYFLRDKQAMAKFVQNPRAYVLPIRPKPLCRFIILGYPFSGKTSLAKALATEFSIPVIDVNTILKNDLRRKKETYQEFCRQKAECREIIRLTAQAWQDWRMEEERRISLIEEWILYIGTLLSKRIEQFYSGGTVDEIPIPSKEAPSSEHESVESTENIQMEAEGSKRSGESSRRGGKQSLEVRGTPIDVSRPSAENRSTPSNKLIQAMKHEDFDFNKNGLEVEANLFFSSLWNSFSGKRRNAEKIREGTEEFGEYDEEGEYDIEEDQDEDMTVDWCNLLPPQSLSSLLMSRKNCTTREKRQSFKIFLEAASKVYWAPSALKSEFAKWRLPCFMDIPLCQVFVDNPILLLRYVPEWLKERPLIPDAVDPMHPSVVEASRKAFLRAQVVSIKQTPEEVGILLRHAIEKAEREGMRVTGEVISPGGWVVDNMSLDMEVWNKLACENVYADHIYFLIDTEPEYRRIFNIWWKHCGSEESSETSGSVETVTDKESVKESGSIQTERFSMGTINPQSLKSGEIRRISSDTSDENNNVLRILADSVKAIREGNAELDATYRSLMQDTAKLPEYFLSLPFVTDEKPHPDESLRKEESFFEDILSLQSETSLHTTGPSATLKVYPTAWNMPLGAPLETVTLRLLNFFKKKSESILESTQLKQDVECGLEFLYFLLTLPKKQQQLKDWLALSGRDTTLSEIEMTNKTPEAIFSDVRTELMAPFIKKPRELEDFEIEEIKQSSEKETVGMLDEEESEFEKEDDTTEDIRIFGESGPLCVVNLERDIFLLGKLEHALRYYGKLYYFWNEDAKNKFIEDPEKYAPYYSAIRCYPPLRIFVTGPVGSGKTTLATSLSLQCGIPRVEFPTFLFQNLVPHSYFSDSLLTDQKLLLSDDHNAAAKNAIETFLNSPQQKRAFLVEQSTLSEFSDKPKIMDKVAAAPKPVVLQSLPKLNYLCVESLLEDELQDEEYEELSKSEPSSPQTPYASMEEIETIITNYIRGNNDLNDYCIEKSFKTLWTENPYITEGFVLESFPKRPSDAKSIIENNWIPDLVLELVVPETEVIDRNIDNLMELWFTKLKRETIEEKLLEDTLTSIYSTSVMIRKNELLEERRRQAMEQHDQLEMDGEVWPIESFITPSERSINVKKQTPSKSGMKKMTSDHSSSHIRLDNKIEYNLPESVNAAIEAEVEEILNRELPEPVFNPIFETYDAGKARIIENIINAYRKDIGEIEKVKPILIEAGIPWTEIDGLQSIDEILTNLFIKVDKIRKRLMYKGEFAFTLTMEMAEKLLRQGYYFLSKFGRWCPVQVYRLKNPIHMFRPFAARGKVTPIVYRNYIYFVAGENEKMEFLEHPIKYTFSESHHPNIPLRIAVIGPPKSGKTTLSKRLGMMFDLKVITMGSALRFVLEETPTSSLAKLINSYLKRGCFLPLSLKMEAVMICLNDPSCHTQGFVLDGIPFDAALTQSLAEKGKLPFVIISLVADSHFGKTNREALDLKQFRLPYKNRTNLDTRYQDWNEKYKRFAQWNQDTYNNLYEVNAKLNVVDIFYQAYDIIRKSFFAILYYVEYCISGRVLPLQYLCVSQHEYELRKSSFHNNCPVCWVEKNRLVSSSDPPPRSGLVQYGNHFYWICPEDKEKFITNPKIYLHSEKLPEDLPKRLKKAAFEADPQMKIHGNGRCPVTRVDFPSHLDWEGSWDFAAYYAGKAFLCKNEEMLNRFLSQPRKYYEADTIFEVDRPTKSSAVEDLGPPKISSLPPIGFLEQTVADLIHDCLQLLGSVRPIYPNMSPTVAGCTFIALYLKAHNKKNKGSDLGMHYFNFMLRSCKAFTFRVFSIRSYEKEIGQGDYEFEGIDDSDTEDSDDVTRCSDQSECHSMLDFGKTQNKMWSAKKISSEYTEMRLTSEDELLEIPVHPKVITVLRYEGQILRSSPIPPVTDCLNFIYSVKPPVKIPEKFNYNCLYQAPSVNPSALTPQIHFNPDKKFAISLYKTHKRGYASIPNVYTGVRTMSDISLREPKVLQGEPDNEYLKKHFIPRFRLYNKLTCVDFPSVPEVVPETPLVYNPHRDYAYTMLLSEFFSTTHVLRCYDWENNHHILELSNRLDNTLGLTNTQVEYTYTPRISASEKSRTSLDSYLQVFDAATLFAVGAPKSESSNLNLNKGRSPSSSTYNFMQTLLNHKMDQLFEDVYCSNLSYDAYEISIAPTKSKLGVEVTEVLPYPPLPWDITCRPYHAYRSLASIFKKPMLDNIAHERHFSLLDGITEQNMCLRFLQIPKNLAEQQKFMTVGKGDPHTQTPRIPPSHYFVYDYFNLPWSSFLTYPISGAYCQQITECTQD